MKREIRYFAGAVVLHLTSCWIGVARAYVTRDGVKRYYYRSLEQAMKKKRPCDSVFVMNGTRNGVCVHGDRFDRALEDDFAGASLVMSSQKPEGLMIDEWDWKNNPIRIPEE